MKLLFMVSLSGVPSGMPRCNWATPRRTSSAHCSPTSGNSKPSVICTSPAFSGSMRVTQLPRKACGVKFFTICGERNTPRSTWACSRTSSPSNLPSSSMALVRYQLRQLMFMLA